VGYAGQIGEANALPRATASHSPATTVSCRSLHFPMFEPDKQVTGKSSVCSDASMFESSVKNEKTYGY